LDIDKIEAQPILFYNPVQSFVPGLSDSLSGVNTATAVAPFNQQLDDDSLGLPSPLPVNIRKRFDEGFGTTQTA
jgi:hypothetical protein